MNPPVAKPRGRPRRPDADQRQVRADIVAAARRLFLRDGVDAVSMRNLAAEIGCSPMALYRYFPRKQDILSAIWDVFLDELFARLAEVDEASPGLRLERLALAYLDYWLAHPQHFQIVFLQRDLEPGATRQYLETSGVTARYALFSATAAEAIQAGALPGPDAEPIAQGLVCLLHGLALNLTTLPDYGWCDAATLARLAVRRYLAGAAG
ncbi:MAG: TetR/AcrR family transcriptional regulator [Gammaproteobacteria bacterium]|jgi:AcrR family transcriptional regulator|nr:TetR/AcrR family transcriptional regulator [Gammaproteobacteria bacterium]